MKVIALLSLVGAIGELRGHRMEATVVQFAGDEPIVAVLARELAKPGKELHKDFLPGEILLLSQEHDELVDVPGAIGDMLGNH